MFSRRHVKLFSIKKEDESNINGGFFLQDSKKKLYQQRVRSNNDSKKIVC